MGTPVGACGFRLRGKRGPTLPGAEAQLPNGRPGIKHSRRVWPWWFNTPCWAGGGRAGSQLLGWGGLGRRGWEGGSLLTDDVEFLGNFQVAPGLEGESWMWMKSNGVREGGGLGQRKRRLERQQEGNAGRQRERKGERKTDLEKGQREEEIEERKTQSEQRKRWRQRWKLERDGGRGRKGEEGRQGRRREHWVERRENQRERETHGEPGRKST